MLVAGTWSPPITTASGNCGRHGLGLGLRQPESPATGRFPRRLDFIDGRIAGGEGQAKSLQEAAR